MQFIKRNNTSDKNLSNSSDDVVNKQFDSLWNTVENLFEIFFIKKSKTDFTRNEVHELYTLVYQMVSLRNSTGIPFASKLYSLTKNYIVNYKNEIEMLSQEFSKKSEKDLLNFFLQETNKFGVTSKALNDCYLFLNKNYVQKVKDDYKKDETQERVYEIYDLCMIIWRSFLVKINNILLPLVLSFIREELIGFPSNVASVESFVNSLFTLDLDDEEHSFYNEMFGNEFFDLVCSFYSKESSLKFSEYSVSDYLKYVSEILKLEDKKLSFYSYFEFKNKLIHSMECFMIKDKLPEIVKELGNFIENEKYDDINIMFNLLINVENGHLTMVESFKNKLKDDIGKIVNSFENDTKLDDKFLVENYIEIYNKYNNIVKKYLYNDSLFVSSFINLFRFCFNSQNSRKIKISEILSIYINNILKKSAKFSNESEIESSLDKVVLLFELLEEKDVFLHFYIKYLSSRLLQDNSQSEDLENTMIYKIKNISGPNYTYKLEKMISDMKINKALDEDYKSYCEGLGVEYDTCVKVLNAGSWAISTQLSELALPKEIIAKMKLFETFYMSKFSGRKLSWENNFSKCELVLNHTKKYIIQCDIFQLTVLLMFGSNKKISFEEICKSTQMKTNKIIQTIKSLLVHKLLLTDVKDNQITNKNNFIFNNKFANQRLKFSILHKVNEMENREDKSADHASIDMNRKFVIQAAIVRIMKMRKVLEHSNLIAEVTKDIKSFKISNPSIIKQEIGVLMEKEYLERTEDKKSYRYLS